MANLENDTFELVGTTIEDRYDMEEAMVETSLSVVYRATHRVWRRPVAIKAFKTTRTDPDEQRILLEAFVREGAILAELSERCAAVCQARDVGALVNKRGEWVPFLVLEWLEGMALEELLHREREQGWERRTVQEAVALLRPVANALALAHERGIVHRDVKPGNIFVLRDPKAPQPCKLLDFGIARVMRHGCKVDPLALSFTPEYAAPEQFSRGYGDVGPWTDVYALALLFVELVIGREALQGETVGALAAATSSSLQRPTPGCLGVPVSPRVEAVCETALALSPRHRFADAAAFWTAMEHAASPVIPEPNLPIPLVRRRERAWPLSI
jgi:serine/threonine protein kinase